MKMNNITVEHLLELVSQIIPGSTYDYARPGTNKARLISVDIASTKIQIARVSGDGTLTQSSIASDSLNTLASRIVEDTPISIDEALLNGGNQRSVVEALLLRTAEFYSCKVGRNKNIVWVPSKPHEIGEHIEINLSELHPDSSVDSILDDISELFAAYLKNEGKSEATIDRYVKQVPNNSEVQNIVRSIAGTTALFDVMDVAKLLQISQKVAAQDFDQKGGNMYSAGINAYTHFISNYCLFVKHIARGNKKTTVQNSNQTNQFPLQQIFYGAPGTGKSHEIDKQTNDDNSIRTTFHPDTDYATFVGAYKPMMDTVEEYALDATGKTHKIDYPNEKSSIIYKYEPQVFLKAYVEAWKRYLNKQEGEDDSYYLIIEEINRGNCAQIFGDLFQLLDREDSGYSSYAISPESAITKYLAEDAQSADGTKFSDLEFSDVTKKRGDVEKIIATAGDLKAGKRLVLPPNLHIWATMNTSDQSLFPIDSAFKRRWDWNYMPIKYDNNEWQIVLGNMEYPWPAFQKEINKRIYDATGSEDKQMGDWFVRAEANKISESLLLNKIVFYLWNDVCKDGEGDIFNIKTAEDKTETVTFSKFFEGNTTEKLQQWMAFLGIEGSKIDAKVEIDDEDETKNHDSNQPYKVTFPDGKVICKGNSWDTYVASLQKIGLDKAFPFGEQYTRNNKTMPLITKEKIEDQGQYKYQYIDGYYVLSGTGSQHRLLKKINEKLGLGLTIE